MARFEHRSFTYFQVDRPVIEGGDAFVRRLKEVSLQLGSITTTALTETVLAKDDERPDLYEPKVMVRPLDEPLLDVFRQNELRLVLYRRVVQSDNMKSYLLTAIESRAQHDPNFAGRLHPNFNESPDDIYRKIMCDRVEYNNDLVYGKTLTLMPEDDPKIVAELNYQAEVCRDLLDPEAPELGRNSAFKNGGIPVASLPEAVNETEAQRFLEIVNDQILPIKVAIGGVQAYRAFALSNDLQLDG